LLKAILPRVSHFFLINSPRLGGGTLARDIFSISAFSALFFEQFDAEADPSIMGSM
jgi:hypothetical protein